MNAIRGALALGILSAVLVACGGGGDAQAPTPPLGGGGGAQTQSWAAGPIEGLGSIIVGGIRYDDSTARIEDLDGNVRERTQLKLGVGVEVVAGAVDIATAQAKAQSVRFGAEILGPIATQDLVANTFTVLGQTVVVKDTTVFDAALTGGLAALKVGDVVEVHAQFDTATGRYSATRIERVDVAVGYALRGILSDLNASAKTFKIGAATFSYANATALPPQGLSNGLRVRVRLQTAALSGVWQATTVLSGVRAVEDRADARVNGLVTALNSTAVFEVDGIKVNAATAEFTKGSTGLAVGARVLVEGRVSAGVLIATKVMVIGDQDVDAKSVELHGVVSALDTAKKTFKLKDVPVDYSRTAAWQGGLKEGDLKNDLKLEVRGLWNDDRTTLRALKIALDK